MDSHPYQVLHLTTTIMPSPIIEHLAKANPNALTGFLIMLGHTQTVITVHGWSQFEISASQNKLVEPKTHTEMLKPS